MIDPTHANDAGRRAAGPAAAAPSRRARAARLLPLLLFAALTAAGAIWAVVEPAAAQENPAAPGQTLPPPEGTPLFFPLALGQPATPRVFDSVEVEGGSLGWPAQVSPDVNLVWRGYTATAAYLGLVNYDGRTDDAAPQMADIFSPRRLPSFTAAHQVYDWNWNCSPPPGCRGLPLTWPYAVTLLEMATTAGEPLAIASRTASIFNPGAYKAMVLYAEETRLTLTYTRDDSPANGYLLHFEGVTVAPELVALYRQLDAAGRQRLPALRNGEVWGVAAGGTIKVAIRDRGTFMDPRACKDWWVDFRSQCVVQLYRPPTARPTGDRAGE
jgi:hypothetical protein